MKKILIALVLGIAMIALNLNAVQAQTAPKFGHINSVELLQAMPETDSAQIILQAYAKELESNIQTMQTELETKYMDYQNNQAQWSDLIRQTKQKELQDLQTRAQEFMEQADLEYKNQSQKMLAPITEKAKKAIEDVAKEGKYSYIFDTSVGSVLYSVEGDDVTVLVKNKLGLVE